MNVDFEDLDFSRMMCNTQVVDPKKSPQDIYEVLQKHDEFWPSKQFWASHPGLLRGKVFRYIPLVYDKNSPLHDVIDNIKQLKGKAAELALFSKEEDGKYNANIEAMLSCQIPEINKMIIRYITLHKSAQYKKFVILNEVLDGLSARLLQSQDTKDIKSFDETGDRLDEIKQNLLSQDNSKGLEDSLNDYYFADKLELRPEDIARKKAEGVPVV